MRDICFLLANVDRQSPVQLSILNDHSIRRFTAIMVTEPSIANIDGKPFISQHRCWTTITPSTHKQGPTHHAFRSLLYLHKDIPFIQFPTVSPDITAGVITTQTGHIFIASIYIPGRSRQFSTEQDLTEAASTRLATLSEAFASAKVKYGENLPIIVGGDFNRHDPVWGAVNVPRSQYAGEGEPILQWMCQHDTSPALPCGTVTLPRGRSGTTIDLMLVSNSLESQIIQCIIHDTQHGSDHEAISLRLGQSKVSAQVEARHNFRKTDWDKAVKAFESWKPVVTSIDTRFEIDRAVTELQDGVSQCIRDHSPIVQESPYMKAWWDSDLTDLRREYTRLRNWDNTLRMARSDRTESIQSAKQAKHRFHNLTRNKKRSHWNSFLAQTDNIWKAARYLDPQPSAFGNIPSLVTTHNEQEVELEGDDAKATELLRCFFPPVPKDWKEEPPNPNARRIDDPDISVEEVTRAVAKISPYKAPGKDGIPNIAWKRLWPIISHQVTNIFNASYQLGYVPAAWKTARILPLRKPGKPDYRVAKAYRSISLLATLSKLMELVLARRLSY